MFYHKKLGWLTPVLPKEPPEDCPTSPEPGSKPPSPSASGGPLACASPTSPVLRRSSCSEPAASCADMSPVNIYANELPNLFNFVNLNPKFCGGSAPDLSPCAVKQGGCDSQCFMSWAPGGATVPFPCAPNCMSTIPYFPAFLITPNCTCPFPCCTPSPCTDSEPTSCAAGCPCSTPCPDACPSPCPCATTPRDYCSCEEDSNSCMRFMRKLAGKWGIPRSRRATDCSPNVEDISYSPVVDNCFSD